MTLQIKISRTSLLLLAAVLAPREATAQSCQTALEIICTTNGLGEFCNLINEVGLQDVLSSDGDLTVFAPLDGAVQNLRSMIGPDNPDELLDVAAYHIHEDGALFMADVPCQNLLRMTTGRDSRTICVNDVPTWQKGGGNTDDAKPLLVDVDKSACNGVVHIIDRALLPHGASYDVQSSNFSSISASEPSMSTSFGAIIALSTALYLL
jgi:uncharacterized surface protein with fasciclin (FAS1) repeats